MTRAEKVIDRIKKLLELSDSANPNEAALAASLAAEMMAAHELSEAEIRLVDLSPAEEIVKNHWANEGQKKKCVEWHGRLAAALAKSMSCKMFWRRSNIHLFGRKSAVQTVAYTYQYLVREIYRLAADGWKYDGLPDVCGLPSNTQRKFRIDWQRSFHAGATRTIVERLLEQVKPVAMLPKSQALVLVQSDRKEVDTAYRNFASGFVIKKNHRRPVRTADGYVSGMVMGREVNLTGGGAALTGRKKELS